MPNLWGKYQAGGPDGCHLSQEGRPGHPKTSCCFTGTSCTSFSNMSFMGGPRLKREGLPYQGFLFLIHFTLVLPHHNS